MQNNDRLQYTRVAVSDGLSSFKVRGYHEALALASVKSTLSRVRCNLHWFWMKEVV